MSIELGSANVVLTAQQFNPSIVSQPWLIRSGLITEDDLVGSFVFSDTVVQLETAEFQLLVIPPRAQFALKGESQNYQETVTSRLLPLVRRLPETPYRGMGVNLVWQFVPEHSPIAETCRRIFRAPDSPVHRLFETDDAKFGAYLSKDFLGYRLKLDIKPASVERTDRDPQEAIVFAFNFHRDITDEEESVVVIEQLLGRWNEVFEEARRIVHSVEGA